MENGKWKVENACPPQRGKWKVESGKWKVESGERRVKKLITSIHNRVKMPLPLEVV
jgi:hypothetical protein